MVSIATTMEPVSQPLENASVILVFQAKIVKLKICVVITIVMVTESVTLPTGSVFVIVAIVARIVKMKIYAAESIACMGIVSMGLVFVIIATKGSFVS